jgi:ABC-type Fe3+-siderophore transport system permease subunit
MSSKGSAMNTMLPPVSTPDHARLLRNCFVGLAVLSITGTILELAFERHWKDAEQLIPWYAIGGFLIALLVFLVRPTKSGVRTTRAILVPVALTSAVGIYYHVHENFKAGFLDFRYSKKWKTMSFVDHYWTALTKSVGPAPTLAPGVLAFACLCLFLATLRHPVFASRKLGALNGEKAGAIDLTDDSYLDDVSVDVARAN